MPKCSSLFFIVVISIFLYYSVLFAKEKVFSDLGRGMLDNAWRGYNCSLFAYGQTGSGKSYSVMGNDVNRGKSSALFPDVSKSP